MGQLQEEGSGPVHGFRLSTVSASRPTENGTTHEPSGLDLAMKLHYLKVVYIYSAETARDLTVTQVKGPLFTLNDHVSWITGRFRRHDSGRPYIKCNDCGTRFVESQCDLTVEEWLRIPDRSVDESLVYYRPIGPDMAFSPLVYIQMTHFKCGGVALGLSWAHILGDPLSLSHVFNLWTRVFAGEKIHSPITSTQEKGFFNPNFGGKESQSIKRVDPVGDLWVTPNNNKMVTYSFILTVREMLSQFSLKGDEFEIVSGIIWKCIENARGEGKPTTITVIRTNPNAPICKSVTNSQMISSVHVVTDANLEEIVRSIREATDESFAVDAIGESGDGALDFIVYGANLTFVDLRKVDFYEAKIREKSPESVYCNVQEIGDNGTVLVLPAAKEEERLVTMTLPHEEMEKVKFELKKCGLLNKE